MTFHANVFSVTLKVIGIISGLPLRGASVLTYLPDSLNASVRVDSSGEASLTQFPAASYLFHITVPYGVPVSLRQNITQSISTCCGTGEDYMHESFLGQQIPLPIHNATVYQIANSSAGT